jgi:DNA-binding transcriptional LysR family regulator
MPLVEVNVGATDAAVLDAHDHLAVAGLRDMQFTKLEWLAEATEHGRLTHSAPCGSYGASVRSITQYEDPRTLRSDRDRFRHRMELRQLRYLDAVASHRSFTRAALDLHIAQSALSQQVSRLEGELGVELLRRTTRSVHVTEAGELVLTRARRALAEADGVRADLDALEGLVRGTLRLGAGPTVGPVNPAELIADFSRAHPGVAITAVDDVTRTLLDQLGDGALDLVLALVCPKTLDGLEGVQLTDEELVVILPPDHPLTRIKRVRVERLAGEALVTYAAGSSMGEALLALVPDGRVVAEANELETVRELTARGLGVTLMPRSIAEPHSDRLAIRSLTPRQTLPFSLVWRPGERPTPAARAFREHVLSVTAPG